MRTAKALLSKAQRANRAALAATCGLFAISALAQTPGNAFSTSPTVSPALGPTVNAAADVKFRLVDIALSGATLLSADQWRSAVESLFGRDITFAELESARAAIEARFHAQGWRLVTVRIPAQSTADGIVKMDVLEPKLGRVDIKTTSPATSRNPVNWRKALPALVEGSVPDLNALDKQLALANENGSRRSQVTFTLEASKAGRPRELAAEIQAEEQSPSRWQAFVDNTGNRQTGRLRYGLAFKHDDVWGLDHQLGFQIASAPYSEDNPQKFSLLPSSNVQILGISYRVPLPAIAAFIDATLAYSNVNSGTIASVFEVAGRGTTVGLKYTQLLDRVGAWEPRAFAGIDSRRYDSQLLFGGVNLAVPIELHPLQLGLSATKVATPKELWAAGAYASVHFNVPGGSSGSQSSFTATRQGATANYKLLRFGSSINFPLGTWQLSAALDAQYSRDLLVSSEQLAAGGASTVRGFAERGIGGDSGARIQLEALSSNWLPADQQNSLRGVIFIDAASTRRNRPAIFEQASASIAGAGVGLRGVWGPSVWRLDLAKAIHQNTQADRVSGAVHFSAAIGF